MLLMWPVTIYGFLIPAFFSLFGVLGTVMIREKTRAGENQAA